MKNKLIVAGLAVLLVLALSACENEAMDVREAYDKAPAVASVTATLTTGSTGVIVTWDAVEGAGSYQVYAKAGKNVMSVASGQWAQTYAANGTASANTNPDKWSALVSVSYLVSKQSYTFGVATTAFHNPNATYSDWT
ncbi:MAG: hypothetical protein LBU21_09775 [Treponema sp.]|jgi:hypothetical protein|nr:hypothetical protein [Treponema sp.]